jgi:hypothetical protein
MDELTNDLVAALRKIAAILDQPVHRNDCRNGAACDILRGDSASARATAKAAIAHARGEEE